jgi:hypothetical protein
MKLRCNEKVKLETTLYFIKCSMSRAISHFIVKIVFLYLIVKKDCL